MKPRFVGRLGPADAITLTNAGLGFLAVVIAFSDVELAARLVLLAAVADGLDGVVARALGGSPAGEYLDSLADVASFGVAPATVAYVVVRDGWSLSATDPTLRTIVALAGCALFVTMAVTRLGLYTAFDAADEYTEGVQTTLAATILMAAVLAGVTDPTILVGGIWAFVYLMVSTIRYPDLLARDAFLMGVVHVLTVLFPYVIDRTFPYALLTLGVAYLTLGPWLYWRGEWLLLRLFGSGDDGGKENA
ncbi:MAG: protein sorting system archaetidylserine synthase [Halanaeroarchaeum sp.]